MANSLVPERSAVPPELKMDLFWLVAEPFIPEETFKTPLKEDALLEDKRQHLERTHREQILRLLDLQDLETEVFQSTFYETYSKNIERHRFAPANRTPSLNGPPVESEDLMITSDPSLSSDHSSGNAFTKSEVKPELVKPEPGTQRALSSTDVKTSFSDEKIEGKTHSRPGNTGSGSNFRDRVPSRPGSGSHFNAHPRSGSTSSSGSGSHILSWEEVDIEYEKQYKNLRLHQRVMTDALLARHRQELLPIHEEFSRRHSLWSTPLWEGKMSRNVKGAPVYISHLTAYARSSNPLPPLPPILQISNVTPYSDVAALDFAKDNTRFILFKATPTTEEEADRVIPLGFSRTLHQKGIARINLPALSAILFIIPLTRIQPPPLLYPALQDIMAHPDRGFLGLIRPLNPQDNLLAGERGGPWEGWKVDLDAEWSNAPKAPPSV